MGGGGKGGGGGGGADISGVFSQIMAMQEKAAKEAVELKEKQTLKALDAVRENYTLAFGDLMPFQASSYTGLTELHDMLGLARPTIGFGAMHDLQAENLEIEARNKALKEQYEADLEAWRNQRTSGGGNNALDFSLYHGGHGAWGGAFFKPTDELNQYMQEMGVSGWDGVIGEMASAKVTRGDVGIGAEDAEKYENMAFQNLIRNYENIGPEGRPIADALRAFGLQGTGYRERGPRPEAPEYEDLHNLTDLEQTTMSSDQIFEKLFARPGVSARLNMGLRALDRTAAARGNMLSGTHAADVTGFAQELASTEYDKEIARLSALTFGSGDFTKQQSGTQVGLGQDIGSLYDNLGTTQANARISSASAAANAMSNAAMAAAQPSGGGGGGGFGSALGSFFGTVATGKK